MPVITRKAGLPPLVMPNDVERARKTVPASIATKMSDAPPSGYVRVRRGAPTSSTYREHIIGRPPGASVSQ